MLFEQPREPPTTSTASAADLVNPLDYAAAQQDHADEADPRLTRLFDAARINAQYDGVSAGRINALTDAYDQRNAAIAQSTGIKLNNPLRDGYYDEAFARWRAENQYVAPHPPDMSDVQAQKSRLVEIQRDIHAGRLRDAAAANPLYADLIGAERPLEQDAIGLANRAGEEYQAASAAAPGTVIPFVTGLAGGLAGGFRDPVNVAALAVGGGGLKAATTLGQIFEGGIRQGLVNAGVQLLAEPEVQAWRAERGQETGLWPAAEDVGMAALFGAIPGAGIPAAKAGLRGLRARTPADLAARIGEAASGDARAAAALSEHLSPEIAPDLHAALASERLDREAMPALPEGLHPDDAAESMRQALRHAEDPGQPLGEVAGIDRQAPPQELLAPDALDMLLDGQADPATARAVAMRVSDRAEQASVLREAMQERPPSPQDAAIAVSDAMERRAVPEAQRAALGNAEPIGQLDRATRDGFVSLPDPDHAALFDFGERIGSGKLGRPDLAEAQRLLDRFKGFVDESDAPLNNARDLGEMAREYYRDVFQNQRAGIAPDMLSGDDARVAWLTRRGVPEPQPPLREVPVSPVSRETNGERQAHVAELEASFVKPSEAAPDEAGVLGKVPLSEGEGPAGYRLVTRDELLAEQPREHALADLVEACKT